MNDSIHEAEFVFALFKQISLKTVRDDLAGAEVTLNINHIILKKENSMSPVVAYLISCLIKYIYF